MGFENITSTLNTIFYISLNDQYIATLSKIEYNNSYKGVLTNFLVKDAGEWHASMQCMNSAFTANVMMYYVYNYTLFFTKKTTVV